MKTHRTSSKKQSTETYGVGQHIKDTDGRVLFAYRRGCPGHLMDEDVPHHTRAVEINGRQAEIEVCWRCGRVQEVRVL